MRFRQRYLLPESDNTRRKNMSLRIPSASAVCIDGKLRQEGQKGKETIDITDVLADNFMADRMESSGRLRAYALLSMR